MLVYQDDILAFGKTKAEHDQAVQAIIVQRAKQYNIKFSISKLHYCVSEVWYVGFIYNEAGLRFENERIEALLEIKAWNTQKKLQSCIGVFNFERDFIPNMSSVTAPLRELLKNNVVFHWRPAHNEASKKLKELIA